MVPMTSSATVPPADTCRRESAMYPLTALFMTAPVMPMHGRIEESASARRQLRTYARMKPVANAARKFTQSATFSEVPICTRSAPTR